MVDNIKNEIDQTTVQRGASETFEINDEEINVQEIMKKIRNNIEERKKSGAYTQEDESLINSPCNIDNLAPENAQNTIQNLVNTGNLDSPYIISSHRKIIGPILIKGRQMVNGEVRRYIDPCLTKQTNFNMETARAIDYFNKRFLANEERFLANEEKISSLQNDISSMKKIIENQFCGMSWHQFYNMDIKEDDLKGNIDFHKEFISLIREYADKSASGKTPKMIEIGLGTATFSIYLSRYSYYNIGIDNDQFIVKKAIENNKKLGGYAKFILMDAFDLDLFKDGYFDVAFSQGTMEHFNNQQILELLKKQLNIARYVLFSVPSVNWPRREFGNERKMSIEEWRVLLNGSGMRILHLDYYQDKTQIACVLEDGSRNEYK